ncbi:MAG: metal-dependent transcriptional regulator [Thermomicrobium sp.]|nr:metal-dependent transcriptional regulator [Thermomicrobium sp.]MDW8058546.1 metal-dependent transcriptional regulator [Thermomicrobium sp.]
MRQQRRSVGRTAITQAMEDYLKVIFALEREEGRVTTQSIAARLGVQSPSVTNMLKRMAALQLVEHQPYRGVRLTERGRDVALEVIRHHRLLESFLAEVLQYPWEALHEEADRLEHGLSEELESWIDARLGYPTADPHGHPIPRSDGSLPERPCVRLEDVAPGEAVEVLHVADHDRDQLRYLAELGIRPGIRVEVLERLPFEGPLRIRVGEREHYVGRMLSRSVFVSANPRRTEAAETGEEAVRADPMDRTRSDCGH